MSYNANYGIVNFDLNEVFEDVVYEDVAGEFVNPPGGFESREELDTYVRYVAGQRNITLAVRDSNPNEANKRQFVKYVCSFGLIYHESRPKTNERATKTQKQGCPFQLTGVEWIAGENRWFIDSIQGIHNHPFPLYAEGSTLGKISPEQYAVMKEQKLMNISPSNMLAYMKRVDPENVTDQKRVNNAKAKIRKEKREGRSTLQHFFHLLNIKNYRLILPIL